MSSPAKDHTLYARDDLRVLDQLSSDTSACNQINAALICGTAALFHWIAESAPDLARDVELWATFERLGKTITSPFISYTRIRAHGDLVLDRLDQAAFEGTVATAAKEIRSMKKQFKGLGPRLERLARLFENADREAGGTNVWLAGAWDTVSLVLILIQLR